MRAVGLACLLWCLLCSGAQAGAGASLVYGASLPEIGTEPQAGLPHLAALVEQARGRGPTFFVFGGDSLGPSMLGSLDRGTHIIDVLNAMEPDAWGVSKREFIFGEDELSMRAAEAFFPMVLSNVEDTSPDGRLPGLERSVLIERGGLTLGVMTLVGDELMHAYPPQRVRLLDRDAALRRTAADLRARGADLVVLTVDFQLPHAETYLEEGVIDVLLGNSAPEPGRVPTSRGVFVRLDNDGRYAAEIGLPSAGEVAERGGLTPQVPVRLHKLAELPAEPAAQAKVDKYRTQMEAVLSIEIGATSTPLNTERAAVRSGENAFGNLVADALRETLRADVALINGGVIRGNRRYEAGAALFRRDIRTELPFYDEAELIEITGAQLREALENGFSQLEQAAGRFPHVSGMRVEYRPDAEPGRRVASVRVDGRPLDPEKRYTLATSHYLAGGGDGYESLGRGRPLSASGVLLGEVVRQYIMAKGSIAPALDGRLRPVK